MVGCGCDGGDIVVGVVGGACGAGVAVMAGAVALVLHTVLLVAIGLLTVVAVAMRTAMA